MLRLDLANAKDRDFLEKKGIDVKALYKEKAQKDMEYAVKASKSLPTPIKSEKKRSKFGNTITEYNGIKFASKYELEIWVQLEELERVGKIKNLKRQVTAKFVHNGVKIWTTRPDYYWELEIGEEIVPIYADAKNPFTEKSRTFQTSQRMFQAFYGYQMLVFKKGDNIEEKLKEHLDNRMN